ncbi:MAG: glycosyltransferase [Lachnospiraceae bacterium]|nr:glycosyltransferase [Lachnospiraceae bacterium]
MRRKGYIKISIIIPVYNCELYIKECLDSVLQQTLSDIEVICIDDGSTDNSLKILKSYGQADERIIVLIQSNQGAGVARNKGLEGARGEYVAFLDADDYYLDTDALEKMYALCQEKGVSICGSFRKKNENGMEKEENLFHDKSVQPILKKIYQYKDFQMDYDYQSFVFDRRLLLDNSITFPAYRRFQDPPFMVRAMYAAGKFVVADTYLYCYRMPDMPSRFTPDKGKDLLRGLIDNLAFSYEHQLNLLFQKTLERLEYEYKDILLHNLSDNDVESVRLFLKAGEIAAKGLGNPDYMVRPLRMIMQACVCQTTQYGEKLATWIRNQEKTVVYGAGKLAKAFIKYLKTNHLENRVSEIVVSERKGNAETIEGIPVVEISEFQDKNVYILVAVGAGCHKAIEDILIGKGMTKYVLLDDVFLNSIIGVVNCVRTCEAMK